MKAHRLFAIGLGVALTLAGVSAQELEIYRVEDFTPQVMPVHQEWGRSSSTAMPQQRGSKWLKPRFRVAYSETGLYFLVECADTRLSATLQEDFVELWTEDAMGVVLRPDGDSGELFEYIFSPLGFETVLVVKSDGSLEEGRRPPGYGGESGPRVTKGVLVMGQTIGRGQPNQENLEGWVAEVYVPFAAMAPVIEQPPQPGEVWQAAFYRVDYDEAGDKGPRLWAWPGGDHPLGNERAFGTLRFH